MSFLFLIWLRWSVQSAKRKDRKKSKDATCEVCKAAEKKPNQVKVKVRGEIDGGCDGKNQWDDNVHTLVPRMLHVSIIHYDEHDPNKLAKLRLVLDKEYEYLENELFDRGFKNTIKRFLRGKRNKLKARFSQRLTMCTMNIQPNQWERLKEYWNTLLAKKKARQMSKAWSKVVNVTCGLDREGRKRSSIGKFCSTWFQVFISFLLD
jgi:hypothetical protein